MIIYWCWNSNNIDITVFNIFYNICIFGINIIDSFYMPCLAYKNLFRKA